MKEIMKDIKDFCWKYKIVILVVSIFVISSIVVMSQYINKNIREIWVQDVKTTEIEQIMARLKEDNARYIQNTGSQYITGPSKSGRSDELGIYFRDPTSSK